MNKQLATLLFGFATLLSASTFSQEYRAVEADKLAIINTTEGSIYVELAPQFAPKNVQRFLQLSKDNVYNGTAFYRVIEGFVAQAGPAEKASSLTPVPLEAKIPLKDLSYTPVQDNDLFAAQTGFIDGFAIATNEQQQSGWLTHCPGVVAMARDSEADSGKSEFYIVIGQAPRYLDNIMSIFGRVVYGFDVAQRLRRGDSHNNGMFENDKNSSKIINVQLTSDLPENERPVVEVEKTGGEAFVTKLALRKNRTHPFFFKKPPAVLDVCQIPLLSKLKPGKLSLNKNQANPQKPGK